MGNLEGALMLAGCKDHKKICEVSIYMDGLLLRANRTIKVSNRAHHPFKSPKCQPFAYRRHNGDFDYHLDYVLRRHAVEMGPTVFHDNQINACLAIVHLFPSLPISQVIIIQNKIISPSNCDLLLL